ncbi:carboxylesterase family protein [Kutzneria sp. CA-103260]|uniref:carboxylesterase family protein n=1 Tax=Kutzneria sp. CA-103260 TaxID=2802641 RepID=UPI001BAD3C95|nr:carboxylesterase family protein [Kutzneria sp. CA-103260]
MAIVQTNAGTIRGERDAGLHVFRGIPYGEPPTGPHRFLPPEPRRPWPGVRDCVRFGPSCPQDEVPPVARRLSNMVR